MGRAELPQKMIEQIKAAEAEAALALEDARREAEDRRKATALRAREILEQMQRDIERESASLLRKAQQGAALQLAKAAADNKRQREEIRRKAEKNMEKAVAFILQRLTGVSE